MQKIVGHYERKTNTKIDKIYEKTEKSFLQKVAWKKLPKRWGTPGKKKKH